MKLSGQTFSERYSDEVEGLQRCLLEFLKSKNTTSGAGTGTGTADETLDVKMTDDGFPILPSAVDTQRLSKNQYEDIMREFLSQHYCEQLYLVIGSL